LHGFLNEASYADRFSGVVLLASNGKPFFRKVYGVASRRYGVPNRIDTKFNLGSMNKMFTTIAIAQLFEQGRLTYEDPIGRYLGADWVSDEIGRKVLIRHLLTHTAGTGTFFNDVFWKSARDRYRAVDDYKELLAGMKTSFEPGTRWEYSNSGFILLGAIVEKVSGESYFDYVRDHIYRRAGMINTGEFDMDEPIPNLAIGYGKVKNSSGQDVWISNLFYHHIKGSPAGGGFSTADDLLKFDVALRTDRLIRRETRDRLWTPVPGATDGKSEWGYGFICRDDQGLGRVVFHSGGFLGISSTLDMYLDSGLTAVVLSNYSDGLDVVRDRLHAVLIAYRNRSAAPEPGAKE
jgi:CubicO group peptidase (beta-lactamase class C family)